MRLIPCLSPVLFLLLLAADPARANEGPAATSEFGQQGQFLVDASLTGEIAHQTQSLNGQSRSQTAVALSPSLLYFVAPNLAIGGGLLFSSVSQEGTDSVTTFGFGPAVRYNISLGGRLSLLPGASLPYENVSSGPVTATLVQANISVPLMIQAAPHFMFGVGPFLSRTLSNSAKSNGNSADGPTVTTVGIAFSIAGWI